MFARAGGVFIGAVLLWDILFRGQLGFSISFLEEMYSHNLANLMMSPLRPVEFIAALMIMSIVRLLIGMIPVTLLALAFFGFNFWSLGLPLIFFFINLILTSWAIGIFVAGLLAAQRHGRREHGLDHHVPVPAAHLRLLPGDGTAALAAIRRLVAAADLRVRGHARAADRPCVPRRPDAARLLRSTSCCSRPRRWPSCCCCTARACRARCCRAANRTKVSDLL